MAGIALPWRAVQDGVELTVRLTPRGGRGRIDGIIEHGGVPVLALRVAAPPVDGAANAAVIALLADLIGLPKSAVRLIAGDKARIKRLHLIGSDLPARLAALVDRG